MLSTKKPQQSVRTGFPRNRTAVAFFLFTVMLRLFSASNKCRKSYWNKAPEFVLILIGYSCFDTIHS